MIFYTIFTTVLRVQQAHEGAAFRTISLISSGGASTVKEPGHFEVRKSSSQVTRMHFFPKKS